MSGFVEFIFSWMQLVVPQPCFDEFFVNYNFFDVPCLRIVISKCLGYSIILGSVMDDYVPTVQVPQIVKIIRAGNSEGISLVSNSMQIAALMSSFAYSYTYGYPFSSYGDSGFLLIQIWLIAMLGFYYRGQIVQGLFYTVVMVSGMGYLLSPSAPLKIINFLQVMVMPNMIIGRMIQVVTNFRNGSTGQLSIVTYVLLFLGALARVFTSIQETGDFTIVITFLVSAVSNGIILAQVIFYTIIKAKED